MATVDASDSLARSGVAPRREAGPALGLLTRIWYRERLISAVDRALRQSLTARLLPETPDVAHRFYRISETIPRERGLVLRAWLESAAGLCELELDIAPARQLARTILGLAADERDAADLPSPFEEGALVFVLEAFCDQLATELPELGALAPIRVLGVGTESRALAMRGLFEQALTLHDEITLASSTLSVCLRIAPQVVSSLEAEIHPHAPAWEEEWFRQACASDRWLNAPARLRLGQFVLASAELSTLDVGDALLLALPGAEPDSAPAHLLVDIGSGQDLVLPVRLVSRGEMAILVADGPMELESSCITTGETTLVFEASPGYLNLRTLLDGDPSEGCALGRTENLVFQVTEAGLPAGSGGLVRLEGELAVQLLTWRNHASH